MDFVFKRSYRGRVKGVILDWAGTTVDFGCFGPTAVFAKVFERQGVAITMEQARAPMGLMKRDHLRAIAQMKPVADAWMAVHGKPCSENDVDAMFSDFVPLQMACLAEYATPIPGTQTFVSQLRGMKIKVGSTTGYTRDMMEVLIPVARQQGYEPEATVCPTDVLCGRPSPWMCYRNAEMLGVYPMSTMVKIGDTVPDIEEGLNAGMWTVGLSFSGNELGLTEMEYAALSLTELAAKRKVIAEKLKHAGAHFVVDGIWECLPIIEFINDLMQRGERP